MPKIERFYKHGRRLFFTPWSHYYKYINDVLGGEWHCLEEWPIFIGIKQPEDKWFDYEDWRYDGHTAQTITFFGIVIGKGYTYRAEPATEDLL